MGRSLAVHTTVGSATYAPGPVSDDIANQIENQSVFEAGDAAYDDMTVADLRDMIDSRNEGRDDDTKMSRSGTKAELVDTLEDDDK